MYFKHVFSPEEGNRFLKRLDLSIRILFSYSESVCHSMVVQIFKLSTNDKPPCILVFFLQPLDMGILWFLFLFTYRLGHPQRADRLLSEQMRLVTLMTQKMPKSGMFFKYIKHFYESNYGKQSALLLNLVSQILDLFFGCPVTKKNQIKQYR